ncbi:solute carrier family 22 member 5-like [Pristis pectinata]|uniref:solute carrier family 22 member 5-like n=1 Tax=Pristis pectinata TaxID=685728 RepID=UPI00223DDC54|nr:solute carrier family 22 member 5-like [Pristis pectinata]
MENYDEAIAFLGEWGYYQWTIFFSLSVIVIPNGYLALSMVFLADTPQHHCRLNDSSNVSFLDLSLQLPMEEVDGEQIHSKCTRYRIQKEVGFNDTSLGTEHCVDGWVFNTDGYTSTIVTQWDLVCDHNWKGPFTTSVFFFGVLFGSIISGQLSDRYGRRTVLFGAIAMRSISSLLQLASQSWEMFCILYFFVGLGDISSYITTFVLGIEILGKSERIAYSTLGICIFYAFGYILLPIFAYCIRDWRMLLLALTLPEILYIPLWWFIPESPRWLLTQGRKEEAEAILKAAARKNGIVHVGAIFDNTYSTMDPTDRNKHSQNYLDLFATSNIRNVTVILLLMWLICTIGYYGLSLTTPNLHGDPYINCFISAASEIIVYVIVWQLMRGSPRRIVTAILLLFSGSMLLFVQLVPSTVQFVITILVMIGKSGVTAAFTIIYVYSSELYPTVVRSMGVGACSTVSRISSIISPYFGYMAAHSGILAFIVMGSFMIIAGLLSLLLPETHDQPLPETIQQMQPMNW